MLTFPEDGLDLGLALQHVHEDARGRPGGGLAAVLAAVLEADVLHDEAAEVAAAAVPRQVLHLARLPAVELEDLNTSGGGQLGICLNFTHYQLEHSLC